MSVVDDAALPEFAMRPGIADVRSSPVPGQCFPLPTGRTPVSKARRPQATEQALRGAAHDLPNFCLAGSSPFPTTGGVNPTFTINALVANSAAHMLGAWGSFGERER